MLQQIEVVSEHIYLFVCLFIHYLINSFIYLFIYLFIYSFIYVFTIFYVDTAIIVKNTLSKSSPSPIYIVANYKSSNAISNTSTKITHYY